MSPSASRSSPSAQSLRGHAPRLPPGSEPEARVRSTDATILELLREGTERSATFRSLIDAINHVIGFVYVEFGICAFGHVDGCLLPFIAATQGDRYLRVIVTFDTHRREHDRLLALIAHELQHAIEVLEHPEVVDLPTMDAMYRRIGRALPGATGYETAAARAVEGTVLSELSQRRHSKPMRTDED